jgi:hypothetical protein
MAIFLLCGGREREKAEGEGKEERKSVQMSMDELNGICFCHPSMTSYKPNYVPWPFLQILS